MQVRLLRVRPQQLANQVALLLTGQMPAMQVGANHIANGIVVEGKDDAGSFPFCHRAQISSCRFPSAMRATAATRFAAIEGVPPLARRDGLLNAVLRDVIGQLVFFGVRRHPGTARQAGCTLMRSRQVFIAFSRLDFGRCAAELVFPILLFYRAQIAGRDQYCLCGRDVSRGAPGSTSVIALNKIPKSLSGFPPGNTFPHHLHKYPSVDRRGSCPVL